MDQIFMRPTRAFIWSVEMLGRQVEGSQMLDAAVSRVFHMLNRPAGERGTDSSSATSINNKSRGRCCG